jgi:hypothetical protein
MSAGREGAAALVIQEHPDRTPGQVSCAHRVCRCAALRFVGGVRAGDGALDVSSPADTTADLRPNDRCSKPPASPILTRSARAPCGGAIRWGAIRWGATLRHPLGAVGVRVRMNENTIEPRSAERAGPQRTRLARLYVALVAIAGAGLLIAGVTQATSQDAIVLGALVLACAAPNCSQ